MANVNTKIQETTLQVGNRQMVISEEGIWVDVLRENGSIASSVGIAWEELATHEVGSYLSFYEVVQSESDLPALCKAV